MISQAAASLGPLSRHERRIADQRERIGDEGGRRRGAGSCRAEVMRRRAGRNAIQRFRAASAAAARYSRPARIARAAANGRDGERGQAGGREQAAGRPPRPAATKPAPKISSGTASGIASSPPRRRARAQALP